MKDHHSLLTQEPPLSPAAAPGREGHEASDTVPTLMLVPRHATPHRPEEVKGAPGIPDDTEAAAPAGEGPRPAWIRRRQYLDRGDARGSCTDHYDSQGPRTMRDNEGPGVRGAGWT